MHIVEGSLWIFVSELPVSNGGCQGMRQLSYINILKINFSCLK